MINGLMVNKTSCPHALTTCQCVRIISKGFGAFPTHTYKTNKQALDKSTQYTQNANKQGGETKFVLHQKTASENTGR